MLKAIAEGFWGIQLLLYCMREPKHDMSLDTCLGVLLQTVDQQKLQYSSGTYQYTTFGKTISWATRAAVVSCPLLVSLKYTKNRKDYQSVIIYFLEREKRVGDTAILSLFILRSCWVFLWPGFGYPW